MTRTVPITNNRATFAEPAGTEWQLSIDARGFWAPQRGIEGHAERGRQGRENLELNIESLRSIHGFVRSGGVAAPGARLNAYAFLGSTAQQQRATTDLQGRFALDVPSASANVTLIVGVAGRTLHPFTVVPVAEDVVVDVAPLGGELRLRWPPGTRPIKITFNHGVPVPLPDLMDWARTHGRSPHSGGIAVPNVAPGRYQVCTGAICTSGTLAVGSNLELDLTSLLAAAAPK